MNRKVDCLGVVVMVVNVERRHKTWVGDLLIDSTLNWPTKFLFREAAFVIEDRDLRL